MTAPATAPPTAPMIAPFSVLVMDRLPSALPVELQPDRATDPASAAMMNVFM